MATASEITRPKTSAALHYFPKQSDREVNESLLATVSLDQLSSMLTLLARELSEKLQAAKSQACIGGIFSQFQHHPVMVKTFLAAQASKEARIQLLNAFRAGCRTLYDISGIWNQSLNKPYGYPGDFSLLELVYDKIPHPFSNSALGRELDLWSTSSELPRAVAERKNTLRVFLEEFAQRNKSVNTVAKVLSIASGAARELREIPMDLLSHLDITLLDSDPKALNFADRFFTTRPTEYLINTVIGNALDNQITQQLKPNGPFDLIYSFGLYDYLSDEYLLKSISIAKTMLAEDGTFVFCLKDHRYYDAWFYNLLFDWRFLPRTIDDGKALCEKAGLNLKDIFIVQGRAVCIYICSIK